MDTIESRANQHLKYARRVRKGQIADFFFVEGKRLAKELINSEIRVESVYATPAFQSDQMVLCEKLCRMAPQNFTVGASLFSYLSETKTPQGIAAVCGKPSNGRDRIESGTEKLNRGLILLLHGVNNPGNLGAIVRSAEAFGAIGLIVTKGSADPFSAAAVRGSMGSVFRLPVWTGPEFDAAIEWANSHSIRTVCADTSAKSPVNEINWDVGSMLVFGSEAHGLTTAERELVELEFSVSMSGNVESLNLAVAAGIAMYEATRRKNFV